MANPQHIEWLLEGVDSWNERRSTNDFRPDLSGADLETDLDPYEILLDNIDLNHANLAGANLSGAQLVGADFTHAILAGTNLSGAVLISANFSSANLAGATLAHALLDSAVFNDANLREANLTRADLYSATFARANLRRSDLANANLTDADLSDADFTDANLVETKLGGAYLARTDLAAAHPWKATLYAPNISSNRRLLRQTSVRSTSGLLRWVRHLQDEHFKTNDTEMDLYFRGELTARADWKLNSSLVRKGLLSVESDMLRDLISQRPEEFSDLNSRLAQWVLAQHHGLPTRFLDITSNPLVGLFFASESNKDYNEEDGRLHIFATPRVLVKAYDSDSVSVIANFARLSYDDQVLILGHKQQRQERKNRPEDLSDRSLYGSAMNRLYQLIHSEKPYFEERIDPRDFYRVMVVEPQHASERVRAQSGAFLLSAFHEHFESVNVLRLNPTTPIYTHYRLPIPADSKKSIRNELRVMNITRKSLFPGLDFTAEAITDAYRGRLAPQ